VRNVRIQKLDLQMEEERFHPFPGSLANAGAVHQLITQVNITYMGSSIFHDSQPSDFPVPWIQCLFFQL
jgi:hypothetical protein